MLLRVNGSLAVDGAAMLASNPVQGYKCLCLQAEFAEEILAC
jgi:hypothetical protein